MTEKKKEINDHEECEACDVLGDYMCAGRPDDRPGQAQDRIKKE